MANIRKIESFVREHDFPPMPIGIEAIALFGMEISCDAALKIYNNALLYELTSIEQKRLLMKLNEIGVKIDIV